MCGFASAAFAQNVPLPNLDEARDQIRDLERDRAERENRNRRRLQDERPDIQDNPTAGNQAGSPLLERVGPCFQITEVKISGYEVFGKPPPGYKQLENKCIYAADIAETLSNLNLHYSQKGFVTTRVYVPEQNLKPGILELVVVPGTISGFAYKDGRAIDSRIRAAFPTGNGDLLNVRDLEQGLENFNTPRSQSGKFDLLPGQELGETIVGIDASESKRWRVVNSSDNSGFDSTGGIKGSITGYLYNPLNLNDQFSLGVTSTTPFYDRDEKFSDSFTANYSVPFGYWSAWASTSYDQYFFILPGINQSYDVEGNTLSFSGGLERLLYRDQNNKLYANGGLKVSRTRNYIAGFEIESQRRNLTIANLGLRGKHFLGKTTLEWSATGKFGLDIFDAYVFDKSIVNPEFRSISGQIKLTAPISDTGFTYTGLIKGQYSDDILPGSEQFSIGGRGNVRGFHEDNMYGDSGYYVRNELSYALPKSSLGQVTLFGGVDFGQIEFSSLREWEQDYLIGGAVGARIKFKNNANMELTYARALDAPNEFNADRNQFYLTLGFEF